MPRKASEVVSKGNGPVHQREKFGSGQPTLEDEYRVFEEVLKKIDSYFDRMGRELKEIEDEKKEKYGPAWNKPGARRLVATSRH